MDSSRRTRALRGLVLLAAVVIPFSLAVAQIRGGGDPPGPGDDGGRGEITPERCQARCEAMAEAVFDAAVARGATEEDAQARADAFLERCTACCEGDGHHEPPAPVTCEDRAEAAAARCAAAGGEDCISVFLFTLAACKVREAREPATCRMECAKAAAAAYRACREADGTCDECRQAANEQLAECLEGCPPRPTCESRCEALNAEMLAYCEAMPAADPDQQAKKDAYLAATGAIFEKCNAACEEPPPPAPEPCSTACERLGDILERMCGRITPDDQAKCEELLAQFREQCALELGNQCEEEERIGRLGFRKFRRGDVRRDRRIDLADAVAVLMGLFQADGTILECEDAADANDDGVIDLGDAICILNHIFGGAGPLPPPSEEEDLDGTADRLGCGGA